MEARAFADKPLTLAAPAAALRSRRITLMLEDI